MKFSWKNPLKNGHFWVFPPLKASKSLFGNGIFYRQSNIQLSYNHNLGISNEKHCVMFLQQPYMAAILPSSGFCLNEWPLTCVNGFNMNWSIITQDNDSQLSFPLMTSQNTIYRTPSLLTDEKSWSYFKEMKVPD